MGRFLDFDKIAYLEDNGELLYDGKIYHFLDHDTDHLPFEDVRPVIHAHWILGGAHGFDESITNIMHCSNCKAYFRYQGRKKNVNY